MSQAFDGALSPTPHYYEIRGRAAEIARALGSAVGDAEHLFLGMLHDGGWPVSVISGLIDLGRAEAAVLGIVNGPGYSPPPPPRFPMREDHVRMWGAEVAFDMGDSYVGVEHAFLAMIRTPETVPARALAGLADLDTLEAAARISTRTPSDASPIFTHCTFPRRDGSLAELARAQEYFLLTVIGNIADAPRLLLTVMVPGLVSLIAPEPGSTRMSVTKEPSFIGWVCGRAHPPLLTPGRCC